MSQYTPIYTKPYPDGWIDAPPKETPVTAEILDNYDSVIENIENYLSQNPIESGDGSDVDLTDIVILNSISLGRTGNTGARSVATGFFVEASGENSHAEGEDTHATAQNSYAGGAHTKAAYYAAHAEGSNTEANALASHSEGLGTKASADYQHVQGKYNVEDTYKYAHIVGGGTSDANRKNIHTLDWEGNTEYAGTIKSAGLKLTDTETGQECIVTIANGNLTITEAT